MWTTPKYECEIGNKAIFYSQKAFFGQSEQAYSNLIGAKFVFLKIESFRILKFVFIFLFGLLRFFTYAQNIYLLKIHLYFQDIEVLGITLWCGIYARHEINTLTTLYFLKKKPKCITLIKWCWNKKLGTTEILRFRKNALNGLT